MKNIGYELNRIIEEKKLIKKEVAEKSGINPSYFIQKLKSSEMDAGQLERICKVIGISPAYFFDDWTGENYNIGEVNTHAVFGDANVRIGAARDSMQSQLEDKERIIEEKERIIRILAKLAGVEDSIDTI